MKNTNPYLQQVWNVLPRLLALYDTDPVSPTYGMGDRYRWAWKLIDFGNATFQGAANGLTWLLAHNLLPQGLSEKSIMHRIDAMFVGAKTLTRSNGSLEEAFPNESSFCVTALVAYDLLTAVELLASHIDADRCKRYLEIIRPMICFLHRADETHAFISNHLATAAAALYKWSLLTDEPGKERGYKFLKRVLKEQSREGWFKEYEGADPGYQTLCTYYLTDIHRMCSDLELIEPLRHSIQFLWHFAHPDGSFGGLYGSRNTRFYFPSGIEALFDKIPEAAALASFMRHSVANHITVTLNVLDEPNLIPMFNSYCWAAVLLEKNKQVGDIKPVPCMNSGTWRKDFKEAGLLVDKGGNHYTIISYHKGGVFYHFSRGKQYIDAGVVVRSPNGQYYSTQAYQRDNEIEINGNTVTINAPLTTINIKLPTPLQFIILRVLNITVMQSLTIGNLIKKILVRFLITSKNAAPIRNLRTIQLGTELVMKDTMIGDMKRFKSASINQPFSAIHMASQGYWQMQDDSE